MPIGLLTLEIHLPESHSLKDKRQVLRSLKDRLRGKFNVAVAELDGQDSWQRAVVGIVKATGEGWRVTTTRLPRLAHRLVPRIDASLMKALFKEARNALRGQGVKTVLQPSAEGSRLRSRK